MYMYNTCRIIQNHSRDLKHVLNFVWTYLHIYIHKKQPYIQKVGVTILQTFFCKKCQISTVFTSNIVLNPSLCSAIDQIWQISKHNIHKNHSDTTFSGFWWFTQFCHKFLSLRFTHFLCCFFLIPPYIKTLKNYHLSDSFWLGYFRGEGGGVWGGGDGGGWDKHGWREGPPIICCWTGRWETQFFLYTTTTVYCILALTHKW